MKFRNRLFGVAVGAALALHGSIAFARKGGTVELVRVDALSGLMGAGGSNQDSERNPGKEVIYLNDSAVDPDLSNSKCSCWHFRFDADTSMKMEAPTTWHR